MAGSTFRSALLGSGAIVLALAFAGAATAQTRAPGLAAARGAAAKATEVDALIVTAQRREESLMQVAAPVTAFSAEQRDLEGIKTMEDLTNFTPGLTLSPLTDRVSIRGLGRLPGTYGADASVALYTDDFYASSTLFQAGDSLFIDRFEVLRGPQATLYGHNAIGGAVNAISKRPTDTLFAEARASIGNYNHQNYEAAVSGPIAKGLSFRLAGSITEQSKGWEPNLNGGPTEGGVVHNRYGEAQLQWKGETFEWWGKASVYRWDHDRGMITGLFGLPTVGPVDTALSSGFLAFLFNPNYAFNTSATGPIAGSVTGVPAGFNGDATTGRNIRTFSRNTPLSVDLHDTYELVSNFTYHAPAFDVKYVAGTAQWDFDLVTDFDRSAVTSYRVPIAPGGACALAAAANPGSCAPLTVYPSETLTDALKDDFTSHEITLLSTSNGPVQWIAGAYYFRERNIQTIRVFASAPIGSVEQLAIANPTPLVGPRIAAPDQDLAEEFADVVTRSSAVYGQVDWKLSDSLKFSGGLRYTYDKKSAIETTRFIQFKGTLPVTMNAGTLLTATDITPLAITLVQWPGVTCLPTEQANGAYLRCLADHSSGITGTAAVQWTPSPTQMGYLRYSRGYKSLGLNTLAITPRPEATPEHIDDIEAGWKQTYANNFRLDADVYYYSYTDSQVPIGVDNGLGLVQTQFTNVPKARAIGVEVALDWRPVRNLSLSATYALNDTEITSDCSLVAGKATGACYVDPIDLLATQPTAQPVATVAGQVLQSVRGNQLAQAPRTKISFNANYTFNFQPGDLTLSANYSWRDKAYSSLFKNRFDVAPGWSQVDVQAIWKGQGDRYEIVGSVKNLFDKIGYSQALTGSLYFTGPAHNYNFTPPRITSLEFRYKFF
jgi:iron complex outermembrane receptor protein